jgi:hypothetical protein
VNKCTLCTKRICCCQGIHKNSSSDIRSIRLFLHHTKILFAAALGIEILCISAALIGENSAYYIFGYNISGIILGYVLGFAAAGFTTFMTILGRYNPRNKIDSCCPVLEQQSGKGFFQILFKPLKILQPDFLNYLIFSLSQI